MEFYTNIQNHLVEKRKTLNKLNIKGENLGRFYENLIHDEIRKMIPEIFKIYRGLIISFDDEGDILRSSKSLDMIIVDSRNCTPFYLIDDFIITSPNGVKIVGQIKGYINSAQFKNASANLKSVKDIDSNIKTLFIAFEEFYSISISSTYIDLLSSFSKTKFHSKRIIGSTLLQGEFERIINYINRNL